jgi:hypothetical protein
MKLKIVDNMLVGIIISTSIMYLSLIPNIVYKNNTKHIIIAKFDYGKNRKSICVKLSTVLIIAGLFGGVIGGIASLI